MTFQTEEEAHEALEDTRKPLIDMAYGVAVELAHEHGAVHAQMVETEMMTRGLLSPEDDEKDRRWMGSVFRRKGWEKVSHVKVGNKHRNNHPGWRVLWRLEGHAAPDGSDRSPECAVCGRGEKDRPTLSKMSTALEVMRKLHFPQRKSLTKKENEAMVALGRWLAKTVERGE